jgi:hypothetical protein
VEKAIRTAWPMMFYPTLWSAKGWELANASRKSRR